MKRRFLIAAGAGLAISPLLLRRNSAPISSDQAESNLPGDTDASDTWLQFDPLQDREDILVTNLDSLSASFGTDGRSLPRHQFGLDAGKIDRGEAVTAAPGSTTTEAADQMDTRDAQTMAVNTDNQGQQAVISETEPKGALLESTEVDKSIHFAHDYGGDVYVNESNKLHFQSVFLRLKRLQNTIGFGNFNIVSFDQALKYAKQFSKVGDFLPEELAFIDELFAFNSTDYGFYGDKVTSQLTQTIKSDQVIKIPYTGHYLFKDQSLAHYEQLKKDVGESIILTSGIRSNVKQLYLFLAKTVSVDGNLSRASRSLAPPGYSYHGIGDFDVGRVGWGARNFTDDFAETDEFKKMQDLGYVAIRYNQGNKLGVRYEPWHIKVV